jgi:hypothetical protein
VRDESVARFLFLRYRVSAGTGLARAGMRLLPRRAGLLLSRMARPRRVGMGSGGSLIGIGASIEHHPGLCRVEVSFSGVKDVPAYATAYTLRAIERY